MTILSGRQTVSSFPYLEGTDASEEVYEVAGRASVMGLDKV